MRPRKSANLTKQELLAVRSMKVPQELTLVTEKWMWKFFSALCASMRCFQHRTIPVNSKKQQQIGIKYKLYQLVCWLLS